MKHSVKRWAGVLLAVCMVMAMLPTVALAADTGKAIQLVGGSAANIGGGQADNVWFGSYFQRDAHAKDPVKWRVLSNAGGQLFLLADQNLEVFQINRLGTVFTDKTVCVFICAAFPWGFGK